MAFQQVLALNQDRSIRSGDPEALAAAVGRGADLRIYTSFRFNEHIDVTSSNAEWIDEVSDFRVTYRIDGRWVAGIMNLRMPVDLAGGFGARPSWSFFMYNQDGTQSIARPYLDRLPALPPCGPCPANAPEGMVNYHPTSNYDDGSNAPSSNFVYDFGEYAFFVRDNWREVYAHDEDGKPVSGSLDAFMAAFRSGCEIKAAVRNLLRQPGDPDYELFVHCGSGYYFTESKVFWITSQPAVVVRPALPMRYESGNWSSGNILLRTDGRVEYWRMEPQTLQWERCPGRAAIRYFVR